MYNKNAFSLIEILIALVIVSLITAALTPVITKKLSSSNITIGASSDKIEFQKDCSMFSADCSLCFEDRCVLCTKDCLEEGEFVHTPDCTCQSCNSENKFKNCKKCTSKNCLLCQDTYYLNNGICSSCEDKYYCDGINKTLCPKGYYCQNGVKIACTSDKYNDTLGANSIDYCKNCTDLDVNCSTCNIETGACESCISGYKLNASGVCEFENPCGDLAVLVELSDRKMCITKYNMGDGGLPVSSDVTVVLTETGDCNGPQGFCCWSGKSSGVCNANDSRYSGCYRTVCNFHAALLICNNLTYQGRKWQLPISNDLSQLIEEKMDILVGNGDDSLMLCTHNDTGINSVCQVGAGYCNRSINNNCIPQYIWSGSTAPNDGDQGMAYILNSHFYNAGIQVNNMGVGASVRCVSYIE